MFKKYIEKKLLTGVPHKINIIRIDLVFNSKKMIDLLEKRGNAIKL